MSRVAGRPAAGADDDEDDGDCDAIDSFVDKCGEHHYGHRLSIQEQPHAHEQGHLLSNQFDWGHIPNIALPVGAL